MSLVSEFLEEGVQNFMATKTLSLPGTLADGGVVDYKDPAYNAYELSKQHIRVATAPIEASWKPGPRPDYVKLLLRVSPAYEMLSTGRTAPVSGGGGVASMTGEYERENDALKLQAMQGGKARRHFSPQQYSDQVTARTGMKISDWFNCFFLPYKQGRYVYMQLDDQADYFFTATMNGCSFMVSGDVKRPTVAHLNSTRPEDTLPEAKVSEKTIRKRYKNMTRRGDSKAVLLTKHAGHSTFKGTNVEYKLQDDELDDIDDDDIVAETRNQADLYCFVVGQRDDQGWHFYYQRSAVLTTMGDETRYTATPVAKSFKHKIRQKLGMSYKVKPLITSTTTHKAMVMNHVVTPCNQLPFNLPVGT